MKIKKTIMGAALVAACLVAFPACSGGGGGGGGENGGGTEGKPSGGTDIPTGLAPITLRGGGCRSVSVNNSKWCWSYLFNGSSCYVYLEPSGSYSYNAKFTYNRLSPNEASIEISGNGSSGKEEVTLHMEFISQKSAQGTVFRRLYTNGSGAAPTTDSYPARFTFTF